MSDAINTGQQLRHDVTVHVYGLQRVDSTPMAELRMRD